MTPGSGYNDGYGDGGPGTSGPVPYPSPSSPWSQKSLSHGVPKGQVCTNLYQY